MLYVLLLCLGLLMGGLVIWIIQSKKQHVIEKLDLSEKVKLQAEIASLEKELGYRKENLEKELADFKDRRLEEKYEEIEKLLTAATQEEESLKALKLLCEREAAELKTQQQSLVDSYKRQEEVKQQKDFYRLVLTNDDCNDIDQLNSIAPRLSRPDILYKLIYSTYYKPALDALCGRVIGEKTKSGIYRITNQLDGRPYIGKSVDIVNRWREHCKTALGIGTIAHASIHDIMKNDGMHNFTFEVLEEVPKDKLNEREKYWIAFNESDTWGMNKTRGG